MSSVGEKGFNASMPYERLIRVFRSSVKDDFELYSEHHHTAFEITMILSGSGIYATKYNEYSFSEGDIFFFSTDEIHWIKKLDGKADFLNIHFEPRYIWSDNFGISNAELIKIFLGKKDASVTKLENTSEKSELLRELIFKTEKEYTEELAEYKTMVKIHLVNILLEMVRLYEGSLSNHDIYATSQTLLLIEKAINYIDSHLDSDITLDELSDIAHMSKTYFSGQFRKLNGISPWEYITIKRIERAIYYIENTNLTKIEIAVKCGYNNTSNFYHAFRKVTGKKPSDYKKAF